MLRAPSFTYAIARDGVATGFEEGALSAAKYRRLHRPPERVPPTARDSLPPAFNGGTLANARARLCLRSELDIKTNHSREIQLGALQARLLATRLGPECNYQTDRSIRCMMFTPLRSTIFLSPSRR